MCMHTGTNADCGRHIYFLTFITVRSCSDETIDKDNFSGNSMVSIDDESE